MLSKVGVQVVRSGAQLWKRGIGLTPAARESFQIQDPKDFEDRVKNSKVPVVVDFYASWCNPCRMLAPRIEAIVEEHKGRVNLAKIDIDENTDLALDFEVATVPVLLVFKDGKPKNRLVGLQDLDMLRKWVATSIK